LKILHLIRDEKFPDSAYEFFEAVAPGESTYMLADRRSPIKHLEKINPVRVSKYAFWDPRFIKSLEIYDAIILHSLHPFSLEVLARVKSSVSVLWIGMGYDYYDLLTETPLDLLKPQSKKLHNPASRLFRKGPFKIIKGIINRALHPNTRSKKSLIKRIDLFAPVLESEYLLIKSALKAPFPQYVRWNYGKIADLVDGELGNKSVTDKNILVGNSASMTNNHLDAFDVLAKVGIPDSSKVIVPLSYGDTQYRDKVIAEGRRLFGNQFQPITEFMTMDQYIDLLSTCSSVVMNHLRQQGAGNLFIMLYLGAKVFLDSQNPLYEEFKNMGLIINEMNALGDASLDEPLSAEQQASQKTILKAVKGRAAFEQNTRNVIAELAQLKLEKAD